MLETGSSREMAFESGTWTPLLHEGIAVFVLKARGRGEVGR